MTEIVMPKTEKLDMIANGDRDVTVTVVYDKKKKLPITGTLSNTRWEGTFVLTTATEHFIFEGRYAYFINVNRPSFHINREHVQTEEDLE